jgi:hypothetical protein
MQALRCGARLQRIIGRRANPLLLWLALLYHYLRDGHARRAWRRYLERLRATPEGNRALQPDPAARSAFFAKADGSVPAFVSLEYMAQCAAAHAGLVSRSGGEPPWRQL